MSGVDSLLQASGLLPIESRGCMVMVMVMVLVIAMVLSMVMVEV